MSSDSRILLIDSKMNTVEINLSPNILKMLGVNSNDVKKHKSRRQLYIEIAKFIENLQES